MSALFTPISLGRLALANRIAIAPMCQYSADDGKATSWHHVHLGHLALSGAGLLFLEATAVEPEGRISPRDLGLWSDDTEAALANALAIVRAHSAMPVAIQLAHAGRKASVHVPWEGGQSIPAAAGGWRTVAPSALPFAERDETPIALDDAGLRRVRDAFAAAARRAERLGIQAIELHAAHGYLMHEFLSPLSNRREDRYGGSLENRMRVVLETAAAMREVGPQELPLFVRVSATDWIDGGWDLPQSVALAKALKPLGVDLIDCS